MAQLTEEEKEVLYRAHEIRERLRAEALEAGEISLKEAKKQAREDLEATFGPEASEEDDEDNFVDSEPLSDDEAEADLYPDENETARGLKEQKRKSKKEANRNKKRAAKEKKRERKESRKQSRKEHTVWKKLLKFILVVLIVIALIMTLAYAVIRALLSATNYQPYETSYVRAADVVSEKLVTNILLIGTDNRQASDASRSDAIILVSVNQKKGKLVMTSILRDCYVNIPGYGQNRINHAYQMGGAALLIQTIEENFKVGIDHYMQVDFYSFMKVVDAFGGVDIEVTPEELGYINGYVNELNYYEGKADGTNYLNEAGYQTLNGSQALGYSRIRYIGTDFGRTDRQRTVLNALIKKVKSNPLAIIPACREVLPALTTDISDNEMSMLLLGLPFYAFFDVSQCRVPIDNCWWNELMPNGQEVLGIDFDSNNAQLKSAIYD